MSYEVIKHLAFYSSIMSANQGGRGVKSFDDNAGKLANVILPYESSLFLGNPIGKLCFGLGIYLMQTHFLILLPPP